MDLLDINKIYSIHESISICLYYKENGIISSNEK